MKSTKADSPGHNAAVSEMESEATNEPQLNAENIQGNILLNFSKDQEVLLGLRITDLAKFQQWLQGQVPRVATAQQGLAFKAARKAFTPEQLDSKMLRVTWLHIAFSFAGLKKLTPDAEQFTDEAFRAGLAARSALLGDPTDKQAEGHPQNWVVGSGNKEVEVLLIVAADDSGDMHDEVRRLKSSLRGANVVYEQEGALLGGKLRGHEHFGFLDGVSQPGLRGRFSADPDDVLTVPQNPDNRGQGQPGQDLLWPGEFVFGYPGQNPDDDEEQGEVSEAGPAWARDGAFLVFRRLRQDVQAFHSFLNKQAKSLGIQPDLLGAKLVGRWPSGAPVMRTNTIPEVDNAALGADDCANNHFEFHDATEAILASHRQTPMDCSDEQYGDVPADRAGGICPFSGHIRKTYPRDDISNFKNDTVDPDLPCSGVRTKLKEAETQTHRLLRRGIPFGAASKSTFEKPKKDDEDRGLLFLAYQTSIVDQFEFVTRCWVDNPDFKEPNVGHDPIIGQNNRPGEKRKREFGVAWRGDDGQPQFAQVSTTADWVIPTGGGYFFSPSISALKMLAGLASD